MSLDWTQGTLTAGGKNLEYRCWGRPPSEAPTIVMLHEGLGATALWRDFPERIANATGFGVMAYSRAGYGQSDLADLPRPLDYMTREAVDVLPEVLEALGNDRVVLLGHSDGATIAAEYAGRVSDMRMRALILIAPHFFTEPSGLAEIEKAREAFETTDMRDRMAKYHRDPENTFRGWNDAWLAPGFKAWNVAEVIDYWRIPCLAIQGRDDQYGTLAQIEEIEGRTYSPVDTAIIEGARHAPHLEKPVETLDAVTDFCRRLEEIEAAQPEGV
ncbi:alpha/beta hydrolase [uncultured Maritimibacter sp.]|jgi:pimeloyl-ACP methyl ester carboxylesterase|uniref:alpha/beta fold hydrolase n=1 Tax=uncultured Maritimibacter sp. TaxID=991866 RepID=UPI000B0EA7D7|nr:alpha/beta hydrolase [uncultured Maritimibacter sp.]